MKNGKKFALATLGCRTNQYESAAYAKQLKEMGYSEAGLGESADICIINTCTVTEGADASSRHQIRQLARQHPGAKLVVTGCLADRLPKQIGEMEEVDLLVLNKDKDQLLSQVFPEEELPEFAIDQFGGHTRAFVKVQDGCNSFCTYCIIPYVRGRSRSRKVDSILREVEGLVANGYKEVVITGINVGDFDGGGDPKVSLAELVQLVDQIDGLERIRISSIDPDEVDDQLLDAVVGGKKTCHSMHIVLQSGSNAILKRMNRKYTRQIFMETVRRLKAASADFTFTTDVIVGFPGETDQDFADTIDLMREVKFSKVHMFPYSPRARTRAATYPGQISTELMKQRKQEVLRLAEQIAYELRSQYVGRKMPVLLEASEGEMFCGHTDNFLEVLVPATGLCSNQVVMVECQENSTKGLIGCLSK
ncbi:MAG: tRNA (N(6)-L-threonylcarbamoyladenosine(37)-C(2))-methylthiotransferase MtaB [Verrucomicrobia bacterium]|nr:tRNA (N(6)-L-threonylcarbamoyladenosine(37)-C(2))-methylthiotransferase MtaB [Verrucomicrobiota bacterium]